MSRSTLVAGYLDGTDAPGRRARSGRDRAKLRRGCPDLDSRSTRRSGERAWVGGGGVHPRRWSTVTGVDLRRGHRGVPEQLLHHCTSAPPSIRCVANERRSVCGEMCGSSPAPLGGRPEHGPGALLPRQRTAPGVEEQPGRRDIRGVGEEPAGLGPSSRPRPGRRRTPAGRDAACRPFRSARRRCGTAGRRHRRSDPRPGDPRAGAAQDLERAPGRGWPAPRRRRSRRRATRPPPRPRWPWAVGAAARVGALAGHVHPTRPCAARTGAARGPRRWPGPAEAGDNGGWFWSPLRRTARNWLTWVAPRRPGSRRRAASR